MNIPPLDDRENERRAWRRAALLLACAWCALLGACRVGFFADVGTFEPSVGEVRALLEQDRVREALARAESLNARYRGAEATLVYGWAAWRNGELRLAEAQFRRALDAGSVSANAGLAAVHASTADWEGAVELATAALAGESPGRAHALLASAAWVAGDPVTASRELRAWSRAEPETARGRAADAMASAAARLQGVAAEWVGQPGVVPLVVLRDGGFAVRATVAGEPAVLRVDLTFRQSTISPALAASARLAIDGDAAGNASAAGGSPAVLSPRQAAVEVVVLGDMRLRNAVFAVADLPAGVDGVLAADALAAPRWSLMLDRRELFVAPASVGTQRLDGVAEGEAVAWMQSRVMFEGLAAQLFVFPRVASEVVAAGLDIGAGSRLEAEEQAPPAAGDDIAASLMLGGWKKEVTWRSSSFAAWALHGGVAPTAVLGSDVLNAWRLHWYPRSQQLRVDAPPAAMRLP